MYKKKIAHK